jgi:hypothetical protein
LVCDRPNFVAMGDYFHTSIEDSQKAGSPVLKGPNLADLWFATPTVEEW